METFLTYLAEVNIVLAVMYVGYMLVCSRTTFFGLRRVMLLFIWAVAFIVPFIQVELPFETNSVQHQAKIEHKESELIIPDLPAHVVRQALQGIEKQHTRLLDYIGLVYATIALLLILRHLLQVLSVVRMYKKSRSIVHKEAVPIFLLSGSGASFSFFRWIFIYTDTLRERGADEIIRHEKIHAMQWHSLDVCLGQIFVAMNWLNPFAHLLMVEMRRNLEFLADKGALLADSQKKEYQMNLLKITCGVCPAQIFNSFNYSHLKERIVMMNKKPSREGLRWTYLALLLLTAAFPLLGVFAKEQSDEPEERLKIQEYVTLKGKDEPLQIIKESNEDLTTEELKVETMEQEVLETVSTKEERTTSLHTSPASEEVLVEKSNANANTDNYPRNALQHNRIEGVWAIVSPDSSVVNYKILTSDRRYVNLRSRDGGKTYKITRRGYYQIQNEGVYVEDLKQEYGNKVLDTQIEFKYNIADEKLFLTFNLHGETLNEVWEKVDNGDYNKEF